MISPSLPGRRDFYALPLRLLYSLIKVHRMDLRTVLGYIFFRRDLDWKRYLPRVELFLNTVLILYRKHIICIFSDVTLMQDRQTVADFLLLLPSALLSLLSVDDILLADELILRRVFIRLIISSKHVSGSLFWPDVVANRRSLSWHCIDDANWSSIIVLWMFSYNSLYANVFSS